SCISILNTTELRGWKCGSSRLFFKYWHQEELARLLERLGKAAVVIQKNFRAMSCRRRYLALLAEVRRQRQLQREREEREEEEMRRRQKLLEEEEEKRKRRLIIEQENKRPAPPPVPLPRKKKPEPRPRSILTGPAQSSPLAPVPRPRSKQFEATPFDNDLQVNSDLINLLGQPESEDSAKERRRRRSNTLRWFKETQARKVARNGTFPCWFHGMITRRQAEDLLIDKPQGCFLIRVGQSREGYTLSYRGANRCRHYMIEMQSNGKYVILGEDRAHAALPDLVQYHTQVGIKPFMEILTMPCGQQCDHEPDYEELQAVMAPARQNSSSLDPGEDIYEDPDHVHLKMQRLFLPPGQNPGLEAHKPPVLKRASDRRRRQEAAEPEFNQEEDPEHKGRPVPRLYPSIRLAMREIQQIQQFSASQDQTAPPPHRPRGPWRKKGDTSSHNT
ncbi:myosin-IIIb-like isoform X2, partial [Astyanax mexicanus]